jgi:superfamily II DNA helicase RecQ
LPRTPVRRPRPAGRGVCETGRPGGDRAWWTGARRVRTRDPQGRKQRRDRHSPKRQRGRRSDATPNPVGDPLFEALRALRKELAEEAQVPPYVIFHDSTLREMAAARPASLGDLGRLPGIGAKKLDAYGERFLEAIARN